MGKAAGGMREAAARGPEVIEALFAHVVSERVLVQGWGLVVRDALPGRTGVPLPASGRSLAIDVAVAAAVNVWLDCPWRYRRCRNLRVKIAVVGVNIRDIGMMKRMARIRVETTAPMM